MTRLHLIRLAIYGAIAAATLPVCAGAGTLLGKLIDLAVTSANGRTVVAFVLTFVFATIVGSWWLRKD